MCGIAGYWSMSGSDRDGTAIRRMCDRLSHRGPDASGYFSDKEIWLGHRRLSIIDVSGGDQPLSNEDGSFHVIFNGEIYNYRELRRDLIGRGHIFRTESDTEVLVHLYEDVGERLPEFLNGMFALAIWDQNRRQLFLTRDRLGKKPLYYSYAVPGLRFCFASELKALTVLKDFPCVVNFKALADFLSLSYVPDPDTIYKDVFKLEAGQSLLVDPVRTRARRYWTPQFTGEPVTDLNSVTEELRSLACDSVQRRMISDVPLGVFLSGGLDSSAVLGFMAELTPEPVKSFSIGFAEKGFDELYYARAAAARYGSDHHEEVVTPRIEQVLQNFATYFDEPFGDDSAIPMLYLARMTRQYVTVALTGDGTDELFGGYRRYHFGVLEERIRRQFPMWFRQSVFKLGGQWYPKFDYLPRVLRAKTMLSNLAQDLADAYFTSMSAFRDAGLEGVLSFDARRALNGYSTRDSFHERFEAVRDLSPLDQLQAVDLQTYLPGDILVKTDRTTMAFGLEARAPWLDYRIAELALRLPPGCKVCGMTGKVIFRHAVAPYVSKAALERKKMGFSVPMAAWLRTSLKPVFESLVLSKEIEPFVSLGEVRRIWQEHQSGLRNHQQKLWNLLVFGSWADAHLARACPPADGQLYTAV